jgi:magnesium transporter
MIVDCAVYARGERLRNGVSDVAGTRALAQASGGFVWVGLFEPTVEEFQSVRAEFDLHELAVEDAVKAHQRPKLELYGETLFLVLKTVVSRVPDEIVDIGEVMLFVGADFLVSVRHGEVSGLGDVRKGLEQRPDLLSLGPGAALHALVDHVVDGYQPVVDRLRDAVEQVEADVFSDERTNPVERIYYLRREVLEFHRATAPLIPDVERLAAGDVSYVGRELYAYFRDVADHLLRVVGQLDGFRDLLASILQANLTQVGVRQNEDMRRITAWVAIIAVPTMIAGIYGMNFEHMPELRWRFGYPLVLAVIAVVCGTLYRRFRRAGWL